MEKYIWFFILLSPISIWAQSDVIRLGILPSTYGEGMPLGEYKEFEKNVVKHLKKIQRFKVVREQTAYEDIEYEVVDGFLKLKNKSLTAIEVAPFLLQMVFGDTDWTADANASPNQRGWNHTATVWLTLNVFDVATGTLENSITLTANSTETTKIKRAPPGPQSIFINAVNAAQKSLWGKTKSAVKTLFPIDLSIKEVIEKDDKAVKTILLNGGKFHGIQKGDKVYVYYEKEYNVRGKSTMRHVAIANLSLEKIDTKTSVANVKNGNKAILRAMEEGKDLKCIIRNATYKTKGYGF